MHVPPPPLSHTTLASMLAGLRPHNASQLARALSHLVSATPCILAQTCMVLHSLWSNTPRAGSNGSIHPGSSSISEDFQASFDISPCLQRSVAKVEWSSGGPANIYRVGHKGKVMHKLCNTCTIHMSPHAKKRQHCYGFQCA